MYQDKVSHTPFWDYIRGILTQFQIPSTRATAAMPEVNCPSPGGLPDHSNMPTPKNVSYIAIAGGVPDAAIAECCGPNPLQHPEGCPSYKWWELPAVYLNGTSDRGAVSSNFWACVIRSRDYKNGTGDALSAVFLAQTAGNLRVKGVMFGVALSAATSFIMLCP